MKPYFQAAVAALTLMSCQVSPQLSPNASTAVQQKAQQAQQDAFLCVVEPREDDGSNIKVMNLQNRMIRSVYLPGRVLSMDGNQKSGKLYLSVRSGSQSLRYDLYELDVARLTLSRPASFSQAGIKPIDFEMLDDKVYVSGEQSGRGSLVMHDLSQGGWKQIVSGFPAGFLEWSKNVNQVQSLYFDEERITRTTIDVQQQRITQTQSFAHGIPFGNNLGLAAPNGDYYYALHQLKGLVALYAFDVNTASVNRDVASIEAVGIMYSSAISADGRYLYATIDNRVERYQLQGTEMKRLPAIVLNAKEARHLTLSEDQRTLYVTHDSTASISRIRINPDQTYRVDEIALPGENNEIIVF